MSNGAAHALVSPPDDELREAVHVIRSDPKNVGIGVSKVQAAIVNAHPGWTVSEKRIRKFVREDSSGASNGDAPHGDTKANGNANGKSNGKSKAQHVYPTSKVLEGLDVSKWTSKARVKYFGKTKGKGLIATEKIEEGEVIWKEDPFILAPEWDIYDLQRLSAACGFCSTPLNSSNLTSTCPNNGPANHHCPARYCNRLCLARSSKVHPLLCPAQNPASIPLLTFTRQMDWMALHAVSQCTAKILIANESDEKTFREDWTFVKALAELGMEERSKDPVFSQYGSEPNRETWKRAHTLVVQAFKSPPNPQDQKKLTKILKTPLPDDIEHELFDYDAFLRALGRMSLNLEAHGGLYTLHSHLNHSCTANASVRHFDTRKALSRITVVAKSAIQPGEELLITYVNPDMDLKARRAELSAWGFGLCDCKRCKEEVKDDKKETSTPPGTEDTAAGADKDTITPQTTEEIHPDLDKELKAGFGVI